MIIIIKIVIIPEIFTTKLMFFKWKKSRNTTGKFYQENQGITI